MTIGGATRVVALFGHPVSHSLSPRIHNAAFAAAGVDAVYVACDVAPDRIVAAVEAVPALGLLGANVTIPHKRAVFLAVESRTADAEASGAVNTLFLEGDLLVGDNTDVAAVASELRGTIGLAEHASALLFGTGGAARAAAVALGRLRCRVEVVGRRHEAVEEIVALVTDNGGSAGPVERPDVVINATPVGMSGEPLPERFLRLEPGQAAFDMVYRAEPTPFVQGALDAGAATVDGRGMLIAQAALAFQRWTGLPAPVDVMRRAAALA